jgi:hypothetical protein
MDGAARTKTRLVQKPKISLLQQVSRCYALLYSCVFELTVVLGHTVLHELTHLDALGKAAGLEAPDPNENDSPHGTDDAQPQDTPAGCELKGARKYLQTYINKGNEDIASPDYNAESYAAAATGTSRAYFTSVCSHCLQVLREIFHGPLRVQRD